MKQRPFLLHVFVAWMLVLAGMSIWRGLALWGQRSLMEELAGTQASGTLLVAAALSLLCGIGLAVAAVGLWNRRGWGRRTAQVSVPATFAAYHGYVWLFVRSGLLWDRRWVSLGAALTATAVGVGALAWSRSREWLGLEG